MVSERSLNLAQVVGGVLDLSDEVSSTLPIVKKGLRTVLSPIERPRFDLSRGFINSPGVCCRLQMETTAPVKFRRVPLDPAVHRGMIDMQSPFQHDFFEISVTERVAYIPTDAQKDAISLQMTPFERVLLDHDTSLFCSLLPTGADRLTSCTTPHESGVSGKKHQLPRQGGRALLKREMLPVPCSARPHPGFACKCSTQWNMLSCTLEVHVHPVRTAYSSVPLVLKVKEILLKKGCFHKSNNSVYF